jgi:hypothetical protein
MFGKVGAEWDDWESCQPTVSDYINTVFSASGATVDATIDESKLRMVPQNDMKKVEGFDEAERERDIAQNKTKQATFERNMSIITAAIAFLAAIAGFFK